MSEVLSERDLRAINAVILDGRREPATRGLPWAVVESLLSLVPCDAVTLPQLDPVHDRIIFQQWSEVDDQGIQIEHTPATTARMPPEYWEALRKFEPCTYATRTGDLTSVRMWSDFYTRAQLRAQPLYADFFATSGRHYGLAAAFPTLPGHVHKLSFWRDSKPDFSERDRLVVQLLRPHLWEIRQDSQRRLGQVPQLSRREWDVLELAHQGYGNGDIAKKLFISISTVRKHMEHIFDRTGVRTRSAAVALMMPHRGHHGAATP